ncbi:hypothetical protein SLEP1_g16609 [Rubroshorea leprosula]|uniref:Uncharacterized protein n=1 Tax=Rubroshorea leprosula TaxID=152421 RepID=A0AAV5IRE5_9ROSI|nr:hypothetical protein SLEP1_g16609 [Rubroshorea leprosula]
MNKFLEAAGGVGTPKKGRGKKTKVGRRGEGASVPQTEVQTLAVSQPSNVKDEVTAVEEGPIIAKRRRKEQQEAREEVTELATSSLCVKVGPSATAADVATAFQEQGYIRLQTTSLYDSGMRSTAKRFINAYFLEVNYQCANNEVATRGSIRVVR